MHSSGILWVIAWCTHSKVREKMSNSSNYTRSTNRVKNKNEWMNERRKWNRIESVIPSVDRQYEWKSISCQFNRLFIRFTKEYSEWTRLPLRKKNPDTNREIRTLASAKFVFLWIYISGWMIFRLHWDIHDIDRNLIFHLVTFRQ